VKKPVSKFAFQMQLAPLHLGPRLHDHDERDARGG
jgi:hypothetical protein